jgi:hypothetical protein
VLSISALTPGGELARTAAPRESVGADPALADRLGGPARRGDERGHEGVLSPANAATKPSQVDGTMPISSPLP